MTTPKWVVCPTDPAQAEALARAIPCPTPIAHLLLARGITSAEAAHHFFEPVLADLHDPLLLLGMTSAIN